MNIDLHQLGIQESIVAIYQAIPNEFSRRKNEFLNNSKKHTTTIIVMIENIPNNCWHKQHVRREHRRRSNEWHNWASRCDDRQAIRVASISLFRYTLQQLSPALVAIVKWNEENINFLKWFVLKVWEETSEKKKFWTNFPFSKKKKKKKTKKKNKNHNNTTINKIFFNQIKFFFKLLAIDCMI